jgi:hypothetical protein
MRINKKIQGWRHDSSVEYLPSKYKALFQSPLLPKKEGKKEKKIQTPFSAKFRDKK